LKWLTGPEIQKKKEEKKEDTEKSKAPKKSNWKPLKVAHWLSGLLG